MKKILYCILLLACLIVACEPEVEMDSDHMPIPVVYCLFSQTDTVHQVILTKTFIGNEPTRKMNKISDSLYFQEALVYFQFPMGKDTSRIYLEKKLLSDKLPGLFPHPDHIIYKTSESIPRGANKIELYIEIPGIPTVYSTINSRKMSDDRLTSPHTNGLTIEISEDSPWKIGFGSNSNMWYSYTEAVIELDIIEEDAEMVKNIKKIRFIKKRYSNQGPKEISITTENLLHEIWSGIEINPNVTRRKFGTFKLTVYHGGDQYEKYMKPREVINDYIISSIYTNIINGLGLFTRRDYFIRDNLTFKSYSIEEIIKDHRLQELKFVQ